MGWECQASGCNSGTCQPPALPHLVSRTPTFFFGSSPPYLARSSASCCASVDWPCAPGACSRGVKGRVATWQLTLQQGSGPVPIVGAARFARLPLGRAPRAPQEAQGARKWRAPSFETRATS